MRVDLSPVPFWFHDLCSCLQDCFGALLLHAGHDPIEILGATWSFAYAPEHVRNEEFYYPRHRTDLGADLFAHHAIRADWREAADAREAWKEVRALVAEGRPVIAAVDNFYMPIRPAFGDVHAAHLVVVSGFDDEAGEVMVVECTPPMYHGPIKLETFLAARGSRNEARPQTRDYFFAGTEIRNRWIEASIPAELDPPSLHWVADVVRANGAGWRTVTEGRWVGLAGLAAYLGDVCERSAGPNGDLALSELYTVGWASQAATALHADFLLAQGRRFRSDDLCEAARLVDRLANHWTPLRVIAAHAATGSVAPDSRDELRRRSDRFVADHHVALERLERVADRLARLGSTP